LTQIKTGLLPALMVLAGEATDCGLPMLRRMTVLLAASLLLAAPVQPAGAFQIRRMQTDLGVVLRLRGDVRAADYGRLKATLQDAAVVGLEIRSGGGSLEAGFDIAQVVLDKGLVVYASGECDSVCAVIFFAARERYIRRGCRIGVHSVSNDRGKEDADSARTTLRMSRLLAGLGVPHSIIGKIVTTPPASITFLDNRDLAGLNVHRTNPFRKKIPGSVASSEGDSPASQQLPPISIEAIQPVLFTN
jgi:hypothetical protein